MLATLLLASVMSQATPHKLRWEPAVDLPVSGGLALGWVLSDFVFKKPLAPSSCRWCDTNAFDNAVRSVFNPSLQPSSEGVKAIAASSNVVGFLALPLAVLGVDGLLAWNDGVLLEALPIDALLIFEATFSALALTQVVKFTVGRGRPYTVGASPELLAEARDVADHNMSFFSGHTSLAFAVATSAATVAQLRGYRHAWVLWAVGLPLAATTAVLRLAADKHWMSDVLVGGAIGSAVGILMPTLLHGRVGPVTARLTPLGNGLALSGRF